MIIVDFIVVTAIGLGIELAGALALVALLLLLAVLADLIDWPPPPR